jgi:hypothetical protein
LKSDINEGRIWKSVSEKYPDLGKEEIYLKVTLKIEEEFLRIN